MNILIICFNAACECGEAGVSCLGPVVENLYIYIYIYDSLHVTPYPELQARLHYSPRNPKTNTLTQIVHFPFSRVPEASGREPEDYRKLTGRITCSFMFYRSSGSSQKVPGGLTGSLQGAVVLCGSRKVPGRFPEDRPEAENHLIFQVNQCK